MPHQAKPSTPTPTATTPTARPYNASADFTKLCWGDPAQLRSTLRLRLRLSAHYGFASVSQHAQADAFACQQRYGFASLSASRLGVGRQARQPTFHMYLFFVCGGVRPQLDLADSESRRLEAC